MTYKFEQFKTEITNPSITVVSVNDNLNGNTCGVEILLTTDSAKFGVSLNGFTYTVTWDDADIENWVSLELVKYEI
jgi:hypothetical protein